MNAHASQEIAHALKSRFETDALLGATALPVEIPEPGAAPPAPQLTPEEIENRRGELDAMNRDEVSSCTGCGLAETRTKTVFGQGSPAARIMFVGEAPGRDEDLSGEAFVGRAGQLLTKMIEAMGITRDDVYICNILKCRPPNNRDPAPDEVLACKDYLFRQIQIINPEVIIALGKPASQTLLESHDSIGRLRGRFHEFYPSGSSLVGSPIPLMPTYHPAYLLRSPDEKSKAWSDLKMVMAHLGMPIPERK